jgi:hypothetical protein
MKPPYQGGFLGQIRKGSAEPERAVPDVSMFFGAQQTAHRTIRAFSSKAEPR